MSHIVFACFHCFFFPPPQIRKNPSKFGLVYYFTNIAEVLLNESRSQTKSQFLIDIFKCSLSTAKQVASEITILSWITHTRNHFLQSKVCALPLSTQDTPLVFLKTIIEFIFTLCFKRKKGIRLTNLDVGFDTAVHFLISRRTPIRHGMQRQSC